MNGYRFRRQFGIGRYVVDFYCPKLRLAIEVDGDNHYQGDAIDYDNIRTEYFNECGIQVLRFTNTDVMQNMNGVLQRVSETIIAQRPSTSSG